MRAEGAAPVKAQRPRREQNNEQRSERKPQGKRHNRVKIKLNVRSVVSKKTTRTKNWWFWCIIIASRN